jgi:aminoglycoside phosphotransferase (APT) family kinase protein
MPTLFDRQAAFSGTGAPDIPLAPLEQYLERHLEGFRRPLLASKFNGGQSNPTYHLVTPASAYVLRRKPSGKLLPSAHAIEREYRVTRALHAAGFPVARPLLLCEDTSIIGSAFYVMEHVEGRIFWEPWAPGISGAERHRLFASMNQSIARLHNFDPAKLGLSNFGKAGHYLSRQVKRWSEQYRASETVTIREMDRLIAWLPGAVPQDARQSVVHGDFRLDNIIVHPSQPRVIAVLDWELSTLGDPIADFTYHLMAWFMPESADGSGIGSLRGREKEAGIPALEDYIADYCRLTDRSGIPDLDMYLAFNFFRLAAILQGIAGRVRDGTAANPHASLMAKQVKPLAEIAWHFAEKAGA